MIRMRDIRAAKMCSRGARSWFERHGFDWSDFIKNGISEDDVLSTGCPMGKKVVEAKRERR